MNGVIDLKKATQHLSEDQTAFLARLDLLVKELDEALEAFKDGHPALTTQFYTLVTHEHDFFLPDRRREVQTHVITQLPTTGGVREIVVYRLVEDSTVSYGLYDGIIAANPLVAQCVILKTERLKNLFIPANASVDNEDHTEIIRVGITNLEFILGRVKGLTT